MLKIKNSQNTDTGRRRFLRNASLLALGAAVGVACSKSKSDEKSDNAAPATGGGMTYRLNHNTGDKVSLLGYGCMRFPTLPKPEGSDENPDFDQEEVNRQVDYALAHGVNYFDTSPAYCRGQSERIIGNALSRHPRNSYYIATKLSNFAPQTWTAEASKKMFEDSLRYLQTDYVDYLLLHAIGGGGMDAYNSRYVDNGILDYLIEQRKQGTIRNLGFSYHGDVEVFDHMLHLMDEGKVHWDFAQIQMNYIDWLHAKEVNPRNTDARYLYDELRSRNIPVVIMEPLLGGRLANMPKPIADKMKARRPDDSVASWAFRYAGTPEGVLTVLSGMTYMEHLRENTATYSPLVPITPDEDEFLQRIAVEFLENKTVPCTACAYCMPCPYGLDIPGIFAHYNKCVNDDNVLHDNADPRYREARRAFLVGYDRSVPRLRQADRCIACGECKLHCPQNIDIPAQMARIDKYVESLKQQPPTA